SYLTWDVQATDERSHAVTLYFDCTAEWAVNRLEQAVVWSRFKIGDLDTLRVGTREQPVLAKSGDNLRIDWGYLYLAAPRQPATATIINADQTARGSFAVNGKLPDADDMQMPRAANDRWPVLACTLDFGKVGAKPASRHVLIAYDDLYCLE